MEDKYILLSKKTVEEIIELLRIVDTDLPLSNFDGAIRADTSPLIYVCSLIDKLQKKVDAAD